MFDAGPDHQIKSDGTALTTDKSPTGTRLPSKLIAHRTLDRL